MPYSSIALAIADGIATLTLSRPDKLNPLDWGTVKELRKAVLDIGARKGTRICIITGAGRAFSAGGDLEKYITLYRDKPGLQGFLDDFHHLLCEIERSPVIYLAAVNGPCVAGGIELMLACDLVVAANEAKIGCGHVNFGQLPGAGGSQRLPRTIGKLRAKHLMLTGKLVDGQDAERIGLVGQSVPLAELLPTARSLAETIREKSPSGIRGMKRLINQGYDMPFDAALRFEVAYAHGYASTDPDPMEGLIAFKEKRKPRFRQD
ncbi:MAG: enoyl-CoA hydratase/isomerase family protein [Hyphomicrobiaceae bacterium]